MRKTVFALAVSALFFAAPSSAFAKVESLDKANMGTHWYGPERTLESLQGHVVWWEDWGFR